MSKKEYDGLLFADLQDGDSRETAPAAVPDDRASLALYDNVPDAFVSSLDEVDAPAGRRKPQRFDIIRYLLIAVFGALFVFSAGSVAQSVFSYIRGQAIYSGIEGMWDDDSLTYYDGVHLAQSVKNATSLDAHSAANANGSLSFGDGSEGGETMEILISRLNKMSTINPDIYGWINIDACDISYPIVQGRDNSYYLRRDFYKNSLNAGCIFVDYRNSKNLGENYNTVIYGHNMNDGSMFAGIHQFESKSVFDNAKIVITTLDGVFTYEVFSVHVPHERSDYFNTNFASDEDFYEWVGRMRAESTYYKDISLTPQDKVLTLSTCVNTTTLSAYRFAVHAKLVSVTK